MAAACVRLQKKKRKNFGAFSIGDSNPGFGFKDPRADLYTNGEALRAQRSREIQLCRSAKFLYINN